MGDSAGELSQRLDFLELHELGGPRFDPRFQLGVEAGKLGRDGAGAFPFGQELPLVGAAVRGVHDQEAVTEKPALRIVQAAPVDQGGQAAPVRAAKVQRDLPQDTFDPQDRRAVRLIEDARAGGQDELEALADQPVRREPQPAGERAVDPRQGSVRADRQVAHGGLVVELLDRLPRGVRGRSSSHRARKLRIAWVVSSGALMCGQWPVASMTTSSLSGRCRCM